MTLKKLRELRNLLSIILAAAKDKNLPISVKVDEYPDYVSVEIRLDKKR